MVFRNCLWKPMLCLVSQFMLLFFLFMHKFFALAIPDNPYAVDIWQFLMFHVCCWYLAVPGRPNAVDIWQIPMVHICCWYLAVPEGSNAVDIWQFLTVQMQLIFVNSWQSKCCWYLAVPDGPYMLLIFSSSWQSKCCWCLAVPDSPNAVDIWQFLTFQMLLILVVPDGPNAVDIWHFLMAHICCRYLADTDCPYILLIYVSSDGPNADDIWQFLMAHICWWYLALYYFWGVWITEFFLMKSMDWCSNFWPLVCLMKINPDMWLTYSWNLLLNIYNKCMYDVDHIFLAYIPYSFIKICIGRVQFCFPTFMLM